MTKYSNTTKPPNQYVDGLREHWNRQRTDKRYTARRNTAVNDCWKPSNEASKADLREFHREEMKLRKAHRRG
jgi:hypothetical protein